MATPTLVQSDLRQVVFAIPSIDAAPKASSAASKPPSPPSDNERLAVRTGTADPRLAVVVRVNPYVDFFR